MDNNTKQKKRKTVKTTKKEKPKPLLGNYGILHVIWKPVEFIEI